MDYCLPMFDEDINSFFEVLWAWPTFQEKVHKTLEDLSYETAPKYF